MEKQNLNYGVIGNCRSAALVSISGSIDWFCMPRFDSSSVFAKLLDNEKGGSFGIEVENTVHCVQKYDGNTNILVTTYTTPSGILEINDFMPRYVTEKNQIYAPCDIIRYLHLVKGEVTIKVHFEPKIEYAKSETYIDIRPSYIKAFTKSSEYNSAYLYSDLPLQAVANHKSIKINKDAYLLMTYNQKLLNQDLQRCYLKWQRTKVYWLNWSERTTQFKQFNEEINRSALVLKLLNYDKTGAVLAAITTSLPETIGEERNWDYRFCWIRDASMVVRIMVQLGHINIAHHYLNFIISLFPDKGEKMQIMYGINGEKQLSEQILTHLSGYENSQPVRIGNAAYYQKQNDIYGILMDVIYHHFKLYTTTLELGEDLWTIVRSTVRTVRENWSLPDRGIWELRNENRHFTFSKVLCWMAIDRAVKIAELLKQSEYESQWKKLREEIHNDIIENAWSEKRQAFTQAYGLDDMDASVLLMETYGFIEPSDPRFVRTVNAIKEDLEYEGLLFRYKNKDDFGTPQSAFTICNFWFINALYKTGQKEEAKRRFKTLLSYSNHLGLFSEDLDFKTKRLLGNFPQAYSHLALIETALTLSDDQLNSDELILNNLMVTDKGTTHDQEDQI